MPFCTSCGAKNADGAASCISCHAPMRKNSFAQNSAFSPPPPPHFGTPPKAEPYPPSVPVSYAPPVSSAPPYIQPVQPGALPDKQAAVMGAWDFWGSILLMNIPLIGWVVCLIWAVSRNINRNRRGLARATLFFLIAQTLTAWAVFRVIGKASALIAASLPQAALAVLEDALQEMGTGWDLLRQVIELLFP